MCFLYLYFCFISNNLLWVSCYLNSTSENVIFCAILKWKYHRWQPLIILLALPLAVSILIAAPIHQGANCSPNLMKSSSEWLAFLLHLQQKQKTQTKVNCLIDAYTQAHELPRQCNDPIFNWAKEKLQWQTLVLIFKLQRQLVLDVSGGGKFKGSVAHTGSTYHISLQK